MTWPAAFVIALAVALPSGRVDPSAIAYRVDATPRPAETPGLEVLANVDHAILRVTPTACGETVVPVVRVTDGDTLRVVRCGVPTTVRLVDVDAPEKAQPGGREAWERLRELAGSAVRIVPVPHGCHGRARDATLAGLTLTCDHSETRDRYGRLLAWAYDGDRDVARELVSEGLAWAYMNGPQYRADQARAKAAGRGIWALPGALAPWEFRRARRGAMAVVRTGK